MKPDYYIIAVHYRDRREDTHIESVKILDCDFDKARKDVVFDINIDKKKVKTAVRKEDGWVEGEDVRVITIDFEKYIRTDANSTARDNLEKLPRF